MSTLVFFHAHPDDECIATGGSMAKAAAAGHRVVLVLATRGEHGEVADGVLAEGESLGEHRTHEVAEAARILGAHRHAFLGYVDSGMMGTPENDAPGSFWTANVDEAAERLAELLREENADVITVYDDHGGYGHPDHIQVHRVGVRAAELAATPEVFEATMNRDQINRMRQRAAATGVDIGGADADESDDDGADNGASEMGTPETELTTSVDVRDFLEVKRQAMIAHSSQIDETSWFLTMPREAFDQAFGTEWYVHRGRPGGLSEDRLV